MVKSVTHHVMGPYHIAHPRPNKPTRVMALGSSFRLSLKGLVPAISYMLHVIFTGLLMVWFLSGYETTRRTLYPAPLTQAKRSVRRPGGFDFLRDTYSLYVENVERDLRGY